MAPTQSLIAQVQLESATNTWPINDTRDCSLVICCLPSGGSSAHCPLPAVYCNIISTSLNKS